ncbi:MAG: DNA-binding response regulator [Chthoniobacterales bacterium]|nr:MAG: DNA-binding response regulator [Chthoniobacterales bacterium]
MPSVIRIVLADDHPIVRQGLRQMIEADSTLKVVGEAGDGKTALALIEQHRPQVGVIDIDMPGGDGFAVARALQKKRPPVELVFLTMHSEAEIFQEAMDLGIKGYVLKDSAVTDIVSSIKSVAAGKAYLSPALSDHVLQRRGAVEKSGETHPGLSDLTPMERRVLKLIAADMSTKEIGAKLFISPRTVDAHRGNICAKLKIHGTLALVRFALTHKGNL